MANVSLRPPFSNCKIDFVKIHTEKENCLIAVRISSFLFLAESLDLGNSLRSKENYLHEKNFDTLFLNNPPEESEFDMKSYSVKEKNKLNIAFHK